MIEISGRKFDKLLGEVAVNLHCQDKLFDDTGGLKEGTTHKDVTTAKDVAIDRYRENMVFNRRVRSMVNSIVQSLDIRIN